MRKLRLSILLIVAMILGLFGSVSEKRVLVSAETETISQTITITEDASYYENIVIAISSGNAFVVNSGATLTLNDLTISGTGSESVANVFYVQRGGKLILNGVTFASDLTATCGVYNQGEVEVHNTTFVSNISNSIVVNSTISHSTKLYSGTIYKIDIEDGYVSVVDSTWISSTIQLSTMGEVDGKLMVKGIGENVFASKYISKFKYVPNNSSLGLFLDYIGDGCDIDNDYGERLNAGDIILTKYTLSTNSGLYSGKYCTSNKFINDNAKQGKFPIYKFGTIYMNNYTYNTTNGYSLQNADVNSYFTQLVVRSYKEGEESPVSEEEYVYPSLSNYAVFVDIPEGYKLKSTSVVCDDGDYFYVDNLYSNNFYMRPIIYCTATSPMTTGCEVDFVFEERDVEAQLSITKDDGVALNHEPNLVVGETYTFSIPIDEDIKIVSVEFNGEAVELTKSNDETEYVFEVELNESNTIVITSMSYDLVVTPNNFTFQYGETISLIQSYHIEETNEDVVITFTPNENNNVNSYPITSGTCSNPEYNVVIAEGEYVYTITPKIVSVSEVVLVNYTCQYSEDMEIVASSFVSSETPDYFTTSLNFDFGDLEIGEQDVEIVVGLINSNYQFDDSSNLTLKVKLIVNPAPLDTSKCALYNIAVTYNGMPVDAKVANLTSLITANYEYYLINEDGSETKVTSVINSGKYKARATLLSTSPCYITSDVLECEIVIAPASVDVSLLVSNFDYGENVGLEPVVDGEIGDDVVVVVLENFIGGDAGEYEVEILSLNNFNYIPNQQYVVVYINPIEIDISGIVYDNIQHVYDGKPHYPVISGTLPTGVVAEINKGKGCINVGEYSVKCSFTSNNKNYVVTEPIYATVTITPRPVSIIFTEPENMLADGQAKKIEVDFDGHIVGETVGYNISYSGDCILPGVYTCAVELKANSNYQILGSKSYQFMILTPVASYESDSINLTLQGKFAPDVVINVSDTSDSLNILNAISDMDCKSYNSFKISYQDYTSEPVTLNINNVNSIDEQYLTIYRVVDGELEEVQYTISNNVISFQIQGSEEILFVESNPSMLKSIIIICTVAFVCAIAVGILISFIIINHNKKRSTK